MIITALKNIFDRDLLVVQHEISLYRSEACIWRVDKAISNSAGNLCLHLVGNLNTYVGNGLGGQQYVRKRELEFSARDLPRVQLLGMLEETRTIVAAALAATKEETLAAPFPLEIRDEFPETGLALIHLAAHLNYHLGQINYHRRLLDRQE